MTYPLGRLVEHDPTSRSYTYPERTLPRAQTSVLWPRYSPILDQGYVGSCTGNAMAGWLGSAPHSRNGDDAAPFDESYALALYELATRLDKYPGTYPPDDTGSSGNAVAKAARRMGQIRNYSWCFTTVSMLNALQHSPVIIGIPWYEAMFTPDDAGEVHIGGGLAGGHEILVRGVEYRPGQDALLHLDNSWGAGWGLAGSFTMSLGTWSQLRVEQADVTVPHD